MSVIDALNAMPPSDAQNVSLTGPTRIAVLEQRKGVLVVCLRMKLEAEDWHAVQDAASDIRELEAQIAVLKSL